MLNNGSTILTVLTSQLTLSHIHWFCNLQVNVSCA